MAAANLAAPFFGFLAHACKQMGVERMEGVVVELGESGESWGGESERVRESEVKRWGQRKYASTATARSVAPQQE